MNQPITKIKQIEQSPSDSLFYIQIGDEDYKYLTREEILKYIKILKNRVRKYYKAKLKNINILPKSK